MIVELSILSLGYGLYKSFFPNQKIKIKKQFKKIFEEKQLKNKKNNNPRILEIDLKNYGAIVKLDIKNICSFEEFKKNEDYIKTSFGALDVDINYLNESIEIQIFLNELQDIKYQKIDLNNFELLLGYDLKGNQIVVDMQKTPHLLISGLSGQGKTYMIKTIIKNLNSRVLMLNAFVEDYKDLNNIIHIQNEEEILKKLESLLNNKYKREKPIYVFFEELATIKNKKIINTLKELLCIARHYNIFLIGLIQISTKEELQCKSYFNARVSFKQIDNSSYQVALGTSISETLNKQEFYLFSDNLYKGKTYLL